MMEQMEMEKITTKRTKKSRKPVSEQAKLPKKLVYFFGNKKTDGGRELPSEMGGKGAGLGEMTRIGLPVPPGFVLSTRLCSLYRKEKKLPAPLIKEIRKAIKTLESMTGTRLGDPSNPLLLSVRSGAAVSMPGMMETILNLGLNEKTAEGLAALTGNECFAHDSYRRFLQMFGDVVLGIPSRAFEEKLAEERKREGVVSDAKLPEASLKKLVREFKNIIVSSSVLVRALPRGVENFSSNILENQLEDVHWQLLQAIGAVFASWDIPRAAEYRRIHNISEELGTAVTVQAMVFGNMGEDSASGVAFTRNPATGEKGVYGEFLINAQGEDVVAGTRDPLPLSRMRDWNPSSYAELLEVCDLLEKHYLDMQDIEFTVQKGNFWMLQCRRGKRAGKAAARIAVEMAKEGLITKEEAVLRLSPEQLSGMLHNQVDPTAHKEVLAEGLPASPGAASGHIVFHPEHAVAWSAQGKKVLLVRPETSPEDIGGMHAAQGILTSRGGMTSHAAVVTRGMGKCCIVGCFDLTVHLDENLCEIKGEKFSEGTLLTLDGTTGEVLRGRVPTIKGEFSTEAQELLQWADTFRTLKVRANADLPEDAAVARKFGAEGIGLCRTEHMFFGEDRILAVRRLIIANSPEARRSAVQEILPMQRNDFMGILRHMDGLPVTIRLLDPPLHEFLPRRKEDIEELAKTLGLTLEAAEDLVERMREANPMLGHRGCRLGITHPEIYEMQVEAIIEAACLLQTEENVRVIPEIMIPLVVDAAEVKILRALVDAVAQGVIDRYPKIRHHISCSSEPEASRESVGITSTSRPCNLDYTVGTMIELPRAALVADEIAKEMDFFSFGTNDLTQTIFGISRDDAASFMPAYEEKKIFITDPFASIDEKGVGRLMALAVELGRKTRKNLKIGICGEHGGDPASVTFCHKLGLDYVSCSPYRVAVARLAAAQAELRSSRHLKK